MHLLSRRGSALFGLLVALVTVGLGAGALGSAPAGEFYAVAVEDAPACAFCELCADPDVRANGHVAYSGPASEPQFNLARPHSTCVETIPAIGDCAHPECGGGAFREVNDSLRSATYALLDDPTPDRAAAMADRFPDFVTLNPRLGTLDIGVPCDSTRSQVLSRVPIGPAPGVQLGFR